MVYVTDGIDCLIETFLLGLLTQLLYSFSQSLHIGSRSMYSLVDFSHTQAWVSSKYNAVVAFGCYVTNLDSEGPKKSLSPYYELADLTK